MTRESGTRTDAPAGRRCSGCRNSLSRYNADDRCQACVSAGRRGEPNPAEAGGSFIDGPKLARLRRERGWTQEVLAERAGLGAVIVRKLEQNARRSARISTLSALATALAVPVSDLLTGPHAEPAGVPAQTELAVPVSDSLTNRPAATGGKASPSASEAKQPGSHRPTLLRALIAERHWQKFSTFHAQFRRAARELAEREQEPDLAKLTVSPRQWERWHAGKVKTEPYPDACRVLEHMFSFPIQQLLTQLEDGERALGQSPGEPADEPGARQRIREVTPGISGAGLVDTYADELRVLMLSEQPLSSARDRERTYDRLVELLTRWAGDMDRRELLRLLGWAATSVAVIPTAGPHLDPDQAQRVVTGLVAPARIDAVALDHLEAVLWHARRADDLLGPHAALQTVVAQRDVIRWILTDCPSPLRDRALALLSVATRVAGWLSFDLGDHKGAWFYYEQARSAAHEARDSALAAQVLCNMSHLATWQGAPRTGLDHAVAAQGWAEQADDLLLKAYAHQVAARAYAADGQMMALRELDRAEALIGAASPSPGSVVHFNNGAQIAGDRSECHLSLGDLTEAASTARHALALQEPSFVRNRAFASLYLGRACLRSHQVEEAAAVIGDAVDLTAQNRSPRLVAQLRQSLAEFAPWRDAREVRHLWARCDTAGITGEGVWPG